MSEIRDYGLDGATQSQLNTSQSPMQPSTLDLEAQSPQSPVQSHQSDNKRPTSPIVSRPSQATPYGLYYIQTRQTCSRIDPFLRHGLWRQIESQKGFVNPKRVGVYQVSPAESLQHGQDLQARKAGSRLASRSRAWHRYHRNATAPFVGPIFICPM